MTHTIRPDFPATAKERALVEVLGDQLARSIVLCAGVRCPDGSSEFAIARQACEMVREVIRPEIKRRNIERIRSYHEALNRTIPKKKEARL
jgi:hypothetical protein